MSQEPWPSSLDHGHWARMALDAAAAGVLLIQGGRIGYANGHAAALLGRARADLIGLQIDALLEGDAPASGEPQGEFDVARPDGSRVVVAAATTRLTINGHEATLAVLHDVTPRRDADAALRANAARYRAALQTSEQTMGLLMDALADGVFVAQDHRFVFANPALPRMLGYSPAQFVNLPFDAVVAPEDLPRWRERFERRIAGEAALRSYEVRFVRADGSSVHLELVASLAGFRGRPAVLGVLRDIGERVRIAADLERRREQLQAQVLERTQALTQADLFARTIADNIPGRVAYWDRDLRCRFVNRPYCEWFGIVPEQVIGRGVEEIFTAERVRPIDARIAAALAGEPQLFERDEVAPNGQPATTLVHFLPDHADGEVRGFYVFAMDITERKQASRRLQTLNDELVVERDRAQAAARAKTAFVANMSHEIRTPMNAIIGLTQLMQREARDALSLDRLAKINDAAHHLLGIINDVLDLSKIDAGKLTLESLDFDLDEVLLRSRSLVAGPAHAKGLQLAVESDGLPHYVRGDPTRLSQLLVNLLGNAVKFTERGSVLLRGTLLEGDHAGLRLRFEVKDTGIGIEPQRLGQLFAAFEQSDSSTTRRFGGTGLGLAITRQLAEQMGGEVGAHSEPGVGSTFWVIVRMQPAAPRALPRSKRPTVLHASAVADGADRRFKARVLLAEDNPVNQEVAKEMLRLVGCEVEVANNGRRAVEMARDGGYDLILMDMQMPELDGVEACRQIRALSGLSRVPIVAMTANAFAEDRAACLAAGMNDHMAKPVQMQALHETLARWLPASRQAAH